MFSYLITDGSVNERSQLKRGMVKLDISKLSKITLMGVTISPTPSFNMVWSLDFSALYFFGEYLIQSEAFDNLYLLQDSRNA